MPELTQSEKLRELRTVFPLNDREIETLQITQRAASRDGEFLSPNMFGLLVITYEWANMPDLDTATTFLGGIVGYGYVTSVPFPPYMTFTGDETETGTEVVTIDLAAAHAANAISTHADIVCAADWYPRAPAGQGSGPAILSIRYKGVLLEDRDILPGLLGPASTVVKTLRIHANGTIEDDPTAPVVYPSIFLVNDNQPFTGNLETGESTVFANRSFIINPFTSGEDGAMSLSLTIDNTDFAISKYLAAAKLNQLPVEVTFRVFLTSDNTGPQNDPPLTLYATDFEAKGSTVSCSLRWIDLQNFPFPNAYYTPSRCPSLQ